MEVDNEVMQPQAKDTWSPQKLGETRKLLP